MTTDLRSAGFPRTNQYHPDWIRASVSGGAHALWLTEWLAEVVPLRPGMRVLDLGCGRAASSIFLAREWDVQVWATDLWTSAAENAQRIAAAGLAERVFSIHADARALPFAPRFFDAIVAIDSFVYYGTDDLYLATLAPLVKPGGLIGIVGAGLTQPLTDTVPAHLQAWWEPALWCLHTAAWWRQHWQRTGIVDVLHADTMADGWQRWLDWQQAVAPDNAVEIAAVREDQGRYLGYTRVVGRRRPDAPLDDPLGTSAAPPIPLLRATGDE